MVSQRKQRQAVRQARPEPIAPRNDAQRRLLDAMHRSDCVIADGPAGTGKTFLCVNYAVDLLLAKEVRKVVFARPTIGVDGNTLGFLPGKLSDKLAPWARPLVQVLKERVTAAKYDAMLADGSVEITSIEHIRGLTFNSTFLVLDEAQNASVGEMKAILTRLGDYSRVVVCGDLQQSDIGLPNGLARACELVKEVPGAERVTFTVDDIVRSELCKQWARAFAGPAA